MTIRNKTLLIIGGLITVAVIGFAVVAQLVLVGGFISVENDATHKDISRAVEAIKTDVETVNRTGADWTWWDDMYQFVQDRNQAYIDLNLTDALADVNVKYWLFYNKKNQLIYTTAYDLDTHEPVKIPASLSKAVATDNKFIGKNDIAGTNDIINLPEGPMIVVSRPTLHGDKSGPPSGTLILATPLDAARIKKISDATHLAIKLYSADSKDLPADVKQYRDSHTTGASVNDPVQKDQIIVKPLNSKTIAGYTTIKDSVGNPGLIVSIEEPRSIYQQGQQTLVYVMAGIAGIGLLLALILGWLLDRFVSGPVSRLSREVDQVHDRDQKHLNASTLKRTDEVGHLAGSINTMLMNLTKAHDELAREKSLVDQKVIERTRELADAQAELAASVRSLPFGFALVGRDNAILFANEVIGRLFNRAMPTGVEDSKKTLAGVSADYMSVIDILGCIGETQATQKPIERNVAFGANYYRFIFTPVISHAKKAEVLGTVMIMEDVTEEKAMQRSRDEFFSIASHELRTPLTAIRGNSQLILDYYQDELQKPDHKEMMTDIHGASVRLIHIVNDFLDVSRLELGKLQFKTEPIDLEKLSRDIIREFDVTGSRRKLKLEVEASPHLPSAMGDADRVRQIVINLLGNALKATTEGGVVIRVSADAHHVKLAMTDTGKGIAIESRHLLFHKFQQASANILTRDSTQSAGLGLYISLLLTKGMGGTLRLESSEVGKGSTFAFELPVAPSKKAESLPASPRKGA